MFVRRRHFQVFSFSLLTLVLLAAGWLCPQSAAATALDKLDTSLKLIPGDAASYWNATRNREQFEAIRNSNALAKLKEMPIFQMGLAFYNMQLASPESKLAKFYAFLQNPESRKVLDLLAEMLSDEIFVYGGKDSVKAAKLLQIIQAAQRYAPVIAQLTGETDSQIQAKAVITALAENADSIVAPDLVLGFKVKNIELAKEQLIKLETIINITLQAQGVDEKIRSHFKKTKIGDYDYLVADLDGSMIPWEQVPVERFKEMEAHPGDVQKIINRLKQSKLVIAIGLRGNYLLFSMGSSLEPLEKLGQGPRLIDRPELKPLEKFVDKRLVSVSYLSQDMSRQLNNYQKQLDDTLEAVKQVLLATKLTKAQKERVGNDVQSLTADLKTIMPEAGAAMAFGFLTDRGIEGYQYSWAGHGVTESSQPLTLLQHVGANPLMGLVARQKADIKDYDLLVKWVKVAYGYFHDFALPKMTTEERAKAEKFLASAIPVLKRLDTTNRELLFPALADGQSAVLVDQKLSTKQLFERMPALDKSMPVVEPAVVLGVTDAALLKKAMSEYRASINQLIDAARQVEGTDIPANIRIPEPEVTKNSLGTIYSFKLPEGWGVDRRIVPNIGLSDNVAVFSLSHAHTDRLLTATPLSVDGVLSGPARPRTAAGWLNWAGLIDAAAPWVDFAVREQMIEGGVDEDQQTAALAQIHTALDVFKVLRTITSESYRQDDAMVSHVLVEIKDIKK